MDIMSYDDLIDRLDRTNESLLDAFPAAYGVQMEVGPDTPLLGAQVVSLKIFS